MGIFERIRQQIPLKIYLTGLYAPNSQVQKSSGEKLYKGYDIRIYNKERMLIELVRYKSKFYSWRYSNGGMADVFIWKKINYFVHTRWDCNPHFL